MGSVVFGFFFAIFFELVVIGFLRFICFYTTVPEGGCKVYMLFGKVVLVLEEPGLHFLWPKLLLRSIFMPFFGSVRRIDMRLDQRYLRSQPVNSEEGAPMGIGAWYEMFVSDPVSFLFKNVDPQGSLAANVGNATVRCLSNMPLARLLEDRHGLSQTVRAEVTNKSQEWGYSLGSVYVRKVHFRDADMIQEIESKVVNRLRQVTAAIKQDGENRVNIITSSAQREAAVEFAKAEAIRPQIVGEVLQEISKDKEVSNALFEVLEVERIIASKAEVILVPRDNGITANLLATSSGGSSTRG